MSPRDPRTIVTPYAFQLDPELLGRPLAGPVRRGAAILVDLALLGTIVAFQAVGGAAFLLLAGWVLWRLASPRGAAAGGGRLRRLLRIAAVVLLLLGGAELVDSVIDAAREEPEESLSPAAVVEGRRGAGIEDRIGGLAGVAGGARDLARLREATGPEEAAGPSRRLALRLYRTGASRSDVEEVLGEILREAEGAGGWTDSVVRRAMAPLDSLARARRARGDSVVADYRAALLAGDTARTEELRAEAREAFAGEELERLRDRIDRLESELREARSGPAVFGWIEGIASGLGFGFGWSGLYFTVFTALWNGRTPGKRLLGIRVVRLSGEPIGWWYAFERFGGYAAGFATGLLGFLQILWDPNRQGIHDKIVGTVVLREGERTPLTSEELEDLRRRARRSARSRLRPDADPSGGGRPPRRTRDEPR